MGNDFHFPQVVGWKIRRQTKVPSSDSDVFLVTANGWKRVETLGALQKGPTGTSTFLFLLLSQGLGYADERAEVPCLKG